MWCVQVYLCDCKKKTEEFWRGSFWDVGFSPACWACKDEVCSGWWCAASEQQIKTRRDTQAARDRQIIREGRSGRHAHTDRRSDKHTQEMNVLVKLLYVLRKRWISSSSCSTFSTLHLQRADVRCEPAAASRAIRLTWGTIWVCREDERWEGAGRNRAGRHWTLVRHRTCADTAFCSGHDLWPFRCHLASRATEYYSAVLLMCDEVNKGTLSPVVQLI